MSNEPTYLATPPPAPKRRLRWAGVALALLLITGAGAGTFASFSASTSNNATFATGTLVLTNTKDTGTTCLSTGGSTTTDVNDNACDALFSLTVRKPGDTATTNITLKNDGTLNATDVHVYAAAACANADAGGETYHGTGLMCSNLQLTIQEYSDAARTTVSSCRYGNAAVANTCDFGDTNKTVGAFATDYPDHNDVLSMGAMNAGTFRYYTISVRLPSTAGNDLQGRQATFGLKWRIIQ